MDMTQEQAKRLEETHDAVTRMEPLLFDLAKAIKGNGQPGLLDRTTALEIHHKECQRKQDQETPQRSNVIAFGSLVVAALAIVLQYIK